MNKKIFFYFFIFLIIVSAVFYLSRFYKTDFIYNITFDLLSSEAEKPVKETVKLHLYDNEEVSISQVFIRAYYFVPKDRGDFIINDWQKVFSRSLENISAFFEFQFVDNMIMDFEVYPEIIYSNRTADYFEDLIKQDYSEEIKQSHSKSLTLEEISGELQEKINIQKKQGDFYLVNLFFLSLDKNENNIPGFSDEGNNCLVMADVFSEEEIISFHESIIAHEIVHSLGVPDFYSYTSDQIESYDLMGNGYFRRLESNYLDDEIKRKMGLD